MNKCNHTNLNQNCAACNELQTAWASKLRDSGFRDLEGLSGKNQILLDSTLSASDEQNQYYSLVWEVYHDWVDQGRSERDLTLCELYATQSGRSGTIMGIVETLKQRKLKPHSKRMVQPTLKEIQGLVVLKNSPQAS